MKLLKTIALCCAAIPFLFSCNQGNNTEVTSGRWSEEKADRWYHDQGWRTGCNYIPSNAVNQLEMWQEDTYSPELIDKELGWAENLGFNTMRVYLHSLVWESDPDGFKNRVDNYLSIAWRHGIKSIIVFFDDCWNPEASVGKQPEPKAGVHNSGWVHDPIVSRRSDQGKNFKLCKSYMQDVLSTFKDDERVLMWDLYNEPGNTGHGNNSMPLLQKCFEWAREVNPSQPVTSGMWNLHLHDLNKFQFENSDIITYHCYLNRDVHQEWIDFLSLYGRPMICTEWMGRRFNSTFAAVMPILKKQNIGAISWGFVAGKTNTIFAWDDPRPDENEPEVWFHDILRQDGTPYDPDEIKIIKSLTTNK